MVGFPLFCVVMWPDSPCFFCAVVGVLPVLCYDVGGGSSPCFCCAVVGVLPVLCYDVGGFSLFCVVMWCGSPFFVLFCLFIYLFILLFFFFFALL